MTWSSSGSAATYPTVVPAGATNPSGVRSTSTLTFRLDPASRIVYVTGTWAPVNTGTAWPTILAAPLPAAFCPQQTASLPPVAGQPWTLHIGRDGAADVNGPGYTPSAGAATGATYRTFYFADTITP